MSKIELSMLEKEAANFDFAALQTHAESAKLRVAEAKTAGDIKAEICALWSKIGKFVKMAEVVPIIGKFVTIIANLLDSLCAA
jgi:hypothetical protein